MERLPRLRLRPPPMGAVERPPRVGWVVVLCAPPPRRELPPKRLVPVAGWLVVVPPAAGVVPKSDCFGVVVDVPKRDVPSRPVEGWFCAGVVVVPAGLLPKRPPPPAAGVVEPKRLLPPPTVAAVLLVPALAPAFPKSDGVPSVPVDVAVAGVPLPMNNDMVCRSLLTFGSN